MSVTILVGGQWGDEGKGKVIDLLADRVDMVVRSQGGNNAGHTVVAQGVEHRFHLIPSGILNPDTLCVIGHGVVVDPNAFLQELERHQQAGIDTRNLMLSDRAHMVMPYHPVLDKLGEEMRGDDRLGTTWRGIGPAYEDKVRRIGFRIGDLQKPAFLEKKLRFVLRLKNETLTKMYGHATFDERAILDEYLGYAERIDPYIRDIYPVIQDALQHDRRILLEGAQGVLLDIDLGTYPYVTSSAPTAGGACTGSGIPPSRVGRTVGVFKAYTTRVGYGPFPTELTGELGDRIREVGHEYGTTTGRARRVGWFDAAVGRYAVSTNGIDSIVLTKVDVLDALPTLRLCTGYVSKGELWDHPMANISHLKHCDPVYEELPGWQTPTRDCRRFEDLPAACRAYIERVGELCGAAVDVVSVGPDREHTLVRRLPLAA
ncbi:MAG: adenylosuccinate synthase [Candidatus Dormibacteraeota bacterium]|nr:adenylosuccinate synthase [Candidatus Dormibacteraeota bacterium]MBV9525512.1 adenylosuccinate synthase [Candidatus Dormibacteraeota bacterium]